MFGKLFGKKEEEKTDAVTSEIVGNTDNAEIVVAPKEEAKETKEVKEEQPAPLTYKEMKSLQKARYEDIAKNPRFKKAYLLKNNKTGQMAEIRAASSFHACNIIGWKANKVTVLKETEIKEPAPETSNTKEVKKADVPETATI